MKTNLVIIAITAVCAMGQSQTLNFDARPGLWETTTLSSGAGLDTSRLPAEMRAKMEEAMKKRPPQAAKPHVTRSCMTKERLQKDMFLDQRQADSCKRMILTNTRTVAEVKIECAEEKMGSTTGTFRLEALSRESVKGTLRTTGAMNIDTTITSKWISDNCGDVK